LNILVFNCGSSSLSSKVFEVGADGSPRVSLSSKAHRVGVTGTEGSFIEYDLRGDRQKVSLPIKTHREAARLVLEYVGDHKLTIDCIGHRFVHGGHYFKKSAMLEVDTLRKLRACLPLAPIHNPISLSVIDECRDRMPRVGQYVTFDSAFHSTIPPRAYRYALPKAITKKFNFRKYGFHGLSYTYVVAEASRFLEREPRQLKMIACHLGTGGSSVAAIRYGRSVDTSMGFSPLPGLVMSTRCGDIDPMLTVYLMAAYGYRPDELIELFNKRSGLLGVSGFSSDVRDIVSSTGQGENERAELALKMYTHRLRKYVGSYVAALGGLDALVFTDDIGVGNWQVRQKACEHMEWCGVALDSTLNQQATGERVCRLNVEGSRVAILTVPTKEELVIALDGIKLFGEVAA